MRETRSDFHEQLQELENEALTTADLAVMALDQVIEAVMTGDSQLAQMVIEGDDRIDGRYLEVHEGILSLLARQSPVAIDLRLVAALLHTIVHLERIGDLCVNIAKLVPLTEQTPNQGSEILSKLQAAAAQAGDQTRQAQVAFRERNLELAEDIVRQDDVIDLLNREVFTAALEIGGADLETREWAAHMMLIARYIERIGDHTVDIGEQIAFVISGEFREFTDASHPDRVGPPRPA
jgi:phosphate transport system protein